MGTKYNIFYCFKSALRYFFVTSAVKRARETSTVKKGGT